ncbi:MAG TPA: ferritin-like domain-containing protein [Vicinamibacterales bacterium]|nr:ferritin-like domain-containing protein [Vicinamibacterales bacterium]
MASASMPLHDLFLDELRDLYDAERQLTKALPKLAKGSASPDLRSAIESHLEETRGHVERLERAFQMLDERARGKHCAGIAGIIEEGSDLLAEDLGDSVMDAGIIAGAQRAEHYEMAAYGSVIAWAKAMGHDDVASLLAETLEEEKAADAKLTELAEGGINEAAATGEGDEEEEETTRQSSSRSKSRMAAESRR